MGFRIIWRKIATITNLATNQEPTLWSSPQNKTCLITITMLLGSFIVGIELPRIIWLVVYNVYKMNLQLYLGWWPSINTWDRKTHQEVFKWFFWMILEVPILMSTSPKSQILTLRGQSVLQVASIRDGSFAREKARNDHFWHPFVKTNPEQPFMVQVWLPTTFPGPHRWWWKLQLPKHCQIIHVCSTNIYIYIYIQKYAQNHVFELQKTMDM